MTSEGEQRPHAAYRSGYVALTGRPNVGKSTLLNKLVGQHLSIVAAKEQTTREKVSGILTTDRFQVRFIDAPGLIQPRYLLQQAMLWEAQNAIAEADIVLLLADATRPDSLPLDELREALARRSIPVLVALNKSDRVDEADRARLLGGIGQTGHECVAISAVTGLGLENLLDRLVSALPVSPPLFPSDEVATQPVRFFVQEYVRESCFEQFRQEIPYSITCRVEEFREARDPIFTRVVIYVERESQKGMVIGKGGSAIKRLGESARRKIEALIERPVFLELRVKVLPGWRRKRARLKELGFHVPAEPGGGQRGKKAVNKRADT